MTATIMPVPRQRYFANNGTPAAGYLLYTYAAGTTDLKPTYADIGQTVPNPNPLTLDAKGEAVIYWDGTYKVSLQKPSGEVVTGFPVDNFQSSNRTTMIPVRNLDALYTQSTVGNPTFQLLGYHAPGDGGGGVWYVDYADTTSADNGGTVIVTASGARIKRIVEGEIDIRHFGAWGDLFHVDTVPINKCLEWAKVNKRTVTCADGRYLVGNLIFGENSSTGQSEAPLGFIGTSRSGCEFHAIPGLTGTLFSGCSLAGVTIRDFSIYTVGTAARAINMDWLPGVGPSTQNELFRVRVEGGTAATHVSLRQLNDTWPTELVVNCTNPAQCCIDSFQSGGLTILERCIWSGGYLNLGAQNALVNGCWGFGIQFAQGAVNNIGIVGGYMYPNEARGQNFWSESFASFQSVHSLTIGPATQVITTATNSTAGVMDLNVLSGMEFIGVEWISLGGTTPMWGPNCRRDSFQNAFASFRGGSYSNDKITLNEPAQFDIEYKGLMQKTTGYAWRNSTKNYFLSGGNAVVVAANTFTPLIPSGSMVAGTYLLTLQWNGNGAGTPFSFQASAVISCTAATEASPSSGASIAANIAEFRPGSLTTVAFRLIATGDGGTPRVDFRCSLALAAPGIITWQLTKLA